MVQAYSGYVCFLAWATGTISRPSSKRAVALALINCGSTVGNIIGSWVSSAQTVPAITHVNAGMFGRLPGAQATQSRMRSAYCVLSCLLGCVLRSVSTWYF